MRQSRDTEERTGRFSTFTGTFDPSIRSSSKPSGQTVRKLYSFSQVHQYQSQSQKQYQMTFGENVGPMADSQFIPDSKMASSNMIGPVQKQEVTRSSVQHYKKMKVQSSPNQFASNHSSLRYSQMRIKEGGPMSVISEGQQAQLRPKKQSEVVVEQLSDEEDKRVGCLCFKR